MNASRGTLLASTVAALFVAACGGSNQSAPATPSAADTAGKVKCVGVNECKAKGACAQEGHACSGKNDCKGKGVTLLTADDCKTKGGSQI